MEHELKIIIGKDARSTKVFVGDKQIGLIQKIIFEATAEENIKTNIYFPNLLGEINNYEDFLKIVEGIKSHPKDSWSRDVLQYMIILSQFSNVNIELLAYQYLPWNYHVKYDILNPILQKYINLKAFW